MFGLFPTEEKTLTGRRVGGNQRVSFKVSLPLGLSRIEHVLLRLRSANTLFCFRKQKQSEDEGKENDSLNIQLTVFNGEQASA